MRVSIVHLLTIICNLVTSWNVEDACSKECVNDELSTKIGFDNNCNDVCRVQQCRYGCKTWRENRNIPCHDICQRQQNSFRRGSMYCLIGCNLATTAYIEDIREKVGIPAAPHLVPGTKTNDSVMIEWDTSMYTNITYLIQFRLDSPPGSWEYYQPENPLIINRVKIRELHPYAKYRFRVAWILLPQYTPLLSPESSSISTLPYGAPSSAPTITRITPISPNHISINWIPPRFPNGPILSYVLYLSESPNSTVYIKDIIHKNGKLYYIFKNLKPQAIYNISIATRNKFGQGPLDTKIFKTLPLKENIDDTSFQAWMLLVEGRKLLKRRLKIVDEFELHYQSSDPGIVITGVAIHVKLSLVFVSDSSGSIHSVSMNNAKEVTTIVNRRRTYPSFLSMDWLNDLLYMVEEKQISRCDIRGHNYEIVMQGFSSRPSALLVDSYHGFLYWIDHYRVIAGLYRADLSSIGGGDPFLSRDAELIVKDGNLNSFAVDYVNFRLFIPKTSNNTIVSVSLDGTEETDVRTNSQQPQFRHIKNLAYHNELFFWQTENRIFGEEYHKTEEKYYHNAYYVNGGPYSHLNVFHPDVQPYPVPLDPVEDVQVIFGEELGKISWKKPRLLNILGKDAWQDWLYEVQLYDHTSEFAKIEINVSSTNYVFRNLYPSTLYSTKVRAFSPRGKGPWSADFFGKTLKPGASIGYPYIIWSTGSELLSSDLLGDGIKLLIPPSYFNQLHIIDISWHNHLHFLITNASNAYMHNMETNSFIPISNITNVKTVAVDWLAPKLYWASPSRHMIFRSNLDGSQPEHFPFLTVARELVVDSLNAYLYWTTAYSVECSRLNGSQHKVFFETGLFSGRYVRGIVLDFDTHNIYWMMKSFEGSVLYKALFASEGENVQESVEVVGSLSEHDVEGPLSIYSERLYWLQDSKQPVISNMTGQSIAYLKDLKIKKLLTLAIVDPSLHPLPDGIRRKQINVIPKQVNGNQINIVGSSNDFNITWKLDSSVNFGTVFYEMNMQTKGISDIIVTEQSYYVFHLGTTLPPYTPINVSIRAYTFWASSQQTIVTLHSPMSIPSQPTSPRVFISYKRLSLMSRYQIDAEFRWLAPTHQNGVILGYCINSWFNHDEHNIPSVQNKRVAANVLSFLSPDILPNTTYYFEVYAYNDAGNGPSAVVKANSSIEAPVPKLLLAKMDSVKVADIDTQEEKILSNKVSHPVDIACLTREGKVFWLEENGSLMSSSLNGSNTALVFNLPYKGTSLSVDWLTRKLYWTQVEKNFGSIWMLDLNFDSKPQIIVNTTFTIAAVEVEPFNGFLYWTLIDDNGIGKLMISDTNGNNIKPFFSHGSSYIHQDKEKRLKRSNLVKTCNCPSSPVVGKAITLDYSDVNKPQIIWVDGRNGHIWSSDFHACICFPLINHPKSREIGLPPTSITVDKKKLYWLNSAKERVYSVTKKQSYSPHPAAFNSQQFDITAEIVGSVRSIRAVDDSLQPLPDQNCLFPQEYNKMPLLISATENSLKLKLQPATLPSSCTVASTPSILYKVYYKKADPVSQICTDHTCLTEETHNSTVTINGLLPFVNYSIQISIKNYYMAEEIKGPITFFRTKEGVPTAPTNVRAITASPSEIIVFWEPPKASSSGPISYKIRWRSDHDNRTHMLSVSDQFAGGVYREALTLLSPGTKYYIVVRACSGDKKMHSDSYEVTNITYQCPSNIQLLKSEPSALFLQWISPMKNILGYTLKVTEVESKENFVQTYQTPNFKYNFTIENLISRTQYAIKLILRYFPYNTTYIHPPEGRGFIFETIGRRPNIPGVPFIRSFGAGSYQVVWEGVKAFKGEIIIYELQFMPIEKTESSMSSEWSTPFSTQSTQWIIEDLPVKLTYIFRVRARNEYGHSNYTSPSVEFFLPEPGDLLDPEDENMAVILASILAVVILIVIILIAGICIANTQNKKVKTVVQLAARNTNAAHTELATLPALPQNGNFVHETNELYNVGNIDHDSDLSGSPQIRREQIILTKLLGRGAFGEVFEGIAHELRGEGTPPVRVAVKTLRKGATDQEKSGFLKEAKLMSNFNHEHILKLLGVCLDNNLNFIILELMEAGDLLMYLRTHRPTAASPSPLKLDDLMSICVDVASGCKYLEDMHFVHRDLAARNCLVSGYKSDTRIVKIGDFGLARDVYKNDYYRKEGEDLLPVRWLAPESLMDGVFTTQSDIWAFGVLLWEVMTLGQQPYPARSNLEVLHYVRDGGHLDKPLNCPDDFFQLMLLCWNYNSADRPSFSYCLQCLKELREITTNRHISFTSVHNHMYSSSVTTDDSSGMLMEENYVYGEQSGTSSTSNLENNFCQENPNRTRNWMLSVDDTASNLSSTGLECGIWHTSCPQINMQSAKTVSYLELLPDQFLPHQHHTDDGYEVPIQLQSNYKRTYGRINQHGTTFNDRKSNSYNSR